MTVQIHSVEDLPRGPRSEGARLVEVTLNIGNREPAQEGGGGDQVSESPDQVAILLLQHLTRLRILEVNFTDFGNLLAENGGIPPISRLNSKRPVLQDYP